MSVLQFSSGLRALWTELWYQGSRAELLTTDESGYMAIGKDERYAVPGLFIQAFSMPAAMRTDSGNRIRAAAVELLQELAGYQPA